VIELFRSVFFCAGAWLGLTAAGALAQGFNPPPRIWDVELGTHVRELPAAEFVDPACGTMGGPPSLRLDSFDDYAKCPVEASGLREVWFIYDDEEEYIYRALAPSIRFQNPEVAAGVEDDRLVQRHRATQVNMQPVILSLLVDGDGQVQGYRIFTDPRTPADLRAAAASLAVVFKARFGTEDWECTDLPPAEGETPIGTPPHDRFVKERCEKIADDRRVVVETRNYYRRGQSYLDPFTRQPMENAFESSASLEVVGLAALPG
jgi:hypothetical protein